MLSHQRWSGKWMRIRSIGLPTDKCSCLFPSVRKESTLADDAQPLRILLEKLKTGAAPRTDRSFGWNSSWQRAYGCRVATVVVSFVAAFASLFFQEVLVLQLTISRNALRVSERARRCRPAPGDVTVLLAVYVFLVSCGVQSNSETCLHSFRSRGCLSENFPWIFVHISFCFSSSQCG